MSTNDTAIKPYGALPEKRQILWHNTELYSLIHFSMSTFLDKEWGYGDEAPDLFNPSAFDAEQWALTCRYAGLKGLILVAKHHDGFCLWPTKTTGHSVKNSKWRDGKGDVVAEVAAACRKYGLKFGVYCSPWDRNHPEYGRAGYVKVYHEQLRELLTNYGPVFELWLDGANGGDGCYGGANEKRPIDGSVYYQWDEVVKMTRELQPDAVIFGFDIRFIGNECGFARETSWTTYPCNTFESESKVPLGSGDRNGALWIPAECDFPLRGGWFFHENDAIKQPDKLVELYFKSVGRGCTMDIGLAPDKRGLIHEDDVAVLKEWKRRIDTIFKTDLVKSVHVNTTGEIAPEESAIVFEFGNIVKFNVLEIKEQIEFGQRIDSFCLDIWQNGEWSELASATSVGYKRLLMVRTSETGRIRIRFTKFSAVPVIAGIGLYLAPACMVLDTKISIVRDRNGDVEIRCGNGGLAIHYTTDGSEPARKSPLYLKPFQLHGGGIVKAAGFMDDAGTPLVSATFGCSRSDWRVVRVSLDSPFNNNGEAGVEKLLDDNPDTYWHTYHKDKKLSAPPHDVVLDMGGERLVEALTMMPHLGGDYGDSNDGTPDKYEFYLSMDDIKWVLAAKGEFANIKANPCMQTVHLEKPVKARYLCFAATHVVDNGNYVKVAGIGAVEVKN